MVWSWSIDYMHGICLGTMKHLMVLWLNSKTNYCIENVNALQAINAVLSSIVTPKRISRKPGNVHDFSSWKANQFRDFLLFFGIVALKNVLKEEYYNNFKLLSEGIYTFCKEEFTQSEFLEASEKLIKFVLEFENLYEESNMRYNIHIITHIPSCVLHLGPLWTCSTFAYESMNNFVNHFINGTNQVMQEASTKMMLYQSHFLGKKIKNTKKTKFYQKVGGVEIHIKPKIAKLENIHEEYLTSNVQYHEIRYFIMQKEYYECATKFKLSNDSYIQLQDGSLAIIEKILIINNVISLLLLKQYDNTFCDGHFQFLAEKPFILYELVSVDNLKKKYCFLKKIYHLQHFQIK
jgi:hypothetical protein